MTKVLRVASVDVTDPVTVVISTGTRGWQRNLQFLHGEMVKSLPVAEYNTPSWSRLFLADRGGYLRCIIEVAFVFGFGASFKLPVHASDKNVHASQGQPFPRHHISKSKRPAPVAEAHDYSSPLQFEFRWYLNDIILKDS